MGVPLVGMGDGALIPHGNTFAITPNPHPNLELEPVAPLKAFAAKKILPQGSPLSCPGGGLKLRHSQGLQTALQWLLGRFLIFFLLSSTRQCPEGWQKQNCCFQNPPTHDKAAPKMKKIGPGGLMGHHLSGEGGWRGVEWLIP